LKSKNFLFSIRVEQVAASDLVNYVLLIIRIFFISVLLQMPYTFQLTPIKENKGEKGKQ